MWREKKIKWAMILLPVRALTFCYLKGYKITKIFNSGLWVLVYVFLFLLWSNCVEWCLKVGKLKFNVYYYLIFLVKMTRNKIIYLFILIIINFIILIKLFMISPVRPSVGPWSNQKTDNQSIFWFFHHTSF